MLSFNSIAHIHALATLLFLTYCLIQDVRTRTIPNKAWIIGAIVLVPLRVPLETTGLVPAITWGIGLTLAALLLWIVRIWGGADAKGTILLAWIIPPFTVGPVTTHALLYSITLSLIAGAIWQRIKPGPIPFYALLSPLTVAGLIFQLYST